MLLIYVRYVAYKHSKHPGRVQLLLSVATDSLHTLIAIESLSIFNALRHQVWSMFYNAINFIRKVRVACIMIKLFNRLLAGS